MERVIIEKKKRHSEAEPIVEIYAQLHSMRVPLPRLFIANNGYVVQWSDGTTEFVPCCQPLNGIKEFVSNYIEGMLTFRTKPVIIVDKSIYKEIVKIVRPIPERIKKSDKEIYNKIAEIAYSLFGMENK